MSDRPENIKGLSYLEIIYLGYIYINMITNFKINLKHESLFTSFSPFSYL